MTYIATANAVHYCGGVPVFADVCPRTMTIDPQDIEHRITSKTRGIIPVHLYGHPAEMGPLNDIAQRHRLWIVEDAAEAHGAEVLGQPVGGLVLARPSVFSETKLLRRGKGGWSRPIMQSLQLNSGSFGGREWILNVAIGSLSWVITIV